MTNYGSDNEGFPFKSHGANCLRWYKILAAAPIIAALSVQREIGGILTVNRLSLNFSSSADRKPLLAATPPATITCCTSHFSAARYVFSTNTSTTLAWKLAATSSLFHSFPRCVSLCT